MIPPRSRRYSGGGAEVALPKGDVTEGVVRVGGTVRRPHQEQSWAVAAYLDHLESVGFGGSPRFLGLDDQGRDVLTFLDGDVAGDDLPAWALADALLASVGRLVRRLHEASAAYVPVEPFPPQSVSQDEFELVSHLDITPQNTVVRGGEAVGVVDFDLAGLTTRLIDSFNTAMHWVPLRAPEDLHFDVDQLARLRVFADAYGWTPAERTGLAEFGARRADLSYERMKLRAETLGGGWERMWREGVGDLIRRRAGWLRASADEIARALD
ncbi:hypothetical protein BH11ACT5_BH11ACT5_01380 [soil metagenome]